MSSTCCGTAVCLAGEIVSNRSATVPLGSKVLARTGDGEAPSPPVLVEL